MRAAAAMQGAGVLASTSRYGAPVSVKKRLSTS